MLSSYSLVSNTRASNRQYILSGDGAAIKNVDRAFVDHHQRALIARPDLTNSSVRERRFIVTEPAEMDRPPLALGSAVLGYLIESFVLYGASVHPNAFFPIERFRVDHNISQSGGVPPLSECGVVVPYSADPLELVAHIWRVLKSFRISPAIDLVRITDFACGSLLSLPAALYEKNCPVSLDRGTRLAELSRRMAKRAEQ